MLYNSYYVSNKTIDLDDEYTMFLVIFNIYWLVPVIYSLVPRPMLFFGGVVVLFQFTFSIVHESGRATV